MNKKILAILEDIIEDGTQVCLGYKNLCKVNKNKATVIQMIKELLESYREARISIEKGYISIFPSKPKDFTRELYGEPQLDNLIAVIEEMNDQRNIITRDLQSQIRYINAAMLSSGSHYYPLNKIKKILNKELSAILVNSDMLVQVSKCKDLDEIETIMDEAIAK